jgi:acetolactate synthase-1/2/3 large subunit/N2-(2-carboxyethyl)arginine synthase
MRGAKLFLQAVARHGVDKVFGIVGGEAAALRFDEVEGLQFYLTRHEFVAGIMADVYGRLTGRPQMCYSTFGPGVTNLTTGVCSAVQDRSPMLAVSAQIVRGERVFNWTHQCIDSVSVMAPMCKYAREIDSVEEIPTLVTDALKAARAEVPGPSFLSFPLDLMMAEIDNAQGERLLDAMASTDPPPLPEPNLEELDWLAQQLTQAKHPIVLAGNVVHREGAVPELKAFLEAWRIPLVTTPASKGFLPEEHELLIGPVNKYLEGILHRRVLDALFANCDLMLLVGYDFGEDVKPVQWMRNPALRNLSLSPNLNPMGKVFAPHQEVIGSLKKALPVLTQKAENRPPSPLLDTIVELKQHKARAGESPSQSYPTIPVPAIVHTIREIIGPHGILCSDVGLHKQYAALFSNTFEANSFMCSNGAGCCGFGLPAAMAAKLAFPDRRVALICGDGGFHATSQDLETARRYNLNFVIVLLKDNAYGLIKYYQLLDKKEIFPGSVDFGDVNFVKLAKANGWKGHFVTSRAELQSRMEKAYKNNSPVLLELPIRYQYNFAAPTGGAIATIKPRE